MCLLDLAGLVYVALGMLLTGDQQGEPILVELACVASALGQEAIDIHCVSGPLERG